MNRTSAAGRDVLKRIDVLGVPVDALDRRQALEVVESYLEGETAKAVLAVNPEKVIRAHKDPSLLRQLQDAGLLLPDGIGVVVAARILGLGRMRRLPGAEFMPDLCALACKRGHGVFLFGAAPDVNARTAEILAERYPGLSIAGREHGYLPEAEMPALIDRINRSGARILFVALGSPRQETWIAQYLPSLNVGICQGVGGTFDVISGRVRRAPAIFRKANLEWFYRLMSQPKRLLRQTALPRFAALVVWKRVAG